MQGMRTEALIVTVLLTLIVRYTTSTNTSTTDGGNGTISGQTLVDLGNQSDQPVLRLIGTLIINLEKEVRSQKNGYLLELICGLHNCTEWGEWSTCSARNSGEFGVRNRNRLCGYNTTFCRHFSESKVGYEKEVCQSPCQPNNCTEWGSWSRCDAINKGDFGNRTRSRRCYFYSTLCGQHLAPQNESELEVCENTCLDDYTTTAHGYCLKMYKSVTQRKAAEATCQRDSGHLANIDSDLVMEDLNDFMLKNYGNNRAGTFWIDGQKSVQAGPLVYGYKPMNSSFFIWGDSEPTNGPDDLCMSYRWMYYNGTRAWRMADWKCSDRLWYICQIID